MRKILLAFIAIIVCTSFTQPVSFFKNAANDSPSNTSAALNYASTYIQVSNSCSDYTVASIAIDDPLNSVQLVSGDMPTPSCSWALCDTDISGVHTMYVILQEWAMDQFATIELIDAAGVYNIQPLTSGNTYVFNNVIIDPGAFITIRLFRTN